MARRSLSLPSLTTERSNPLGAYLLLALSGNIDAKKWMTLYNTLAADIAAYPPVLSLSKTMEAKLNTTSGSMFSYIEGIDTMVKLSVWPTTSVKVSTYWSISGLTGADLA